MYDFQLGVYDNSYRKDDLPILLGDKEKDAALLVAGAPIEQVERIKAPLMLVHGGRDYTVPIAHSERLLEAMRKKGKTVEWTRYPEEIHGFFFERSATTSTARSKPSSPST